MWTANRAEASDSDLTDATDDFYDQVVSEGTRASLLGMPRTSAGSMSQLDSNSFPSLHSELNSKIQEERDALYSCVMQSVSTSLVRTSYIEVSFRVTRLPSLKLGDKQTVLSEIILERSTVALSHDEKRCLTKQLERLQLEVDEFPIGRVSYPMCVTKRSSK
jgi:hypothetical protein